MDRQGRIVWYYADAASNATSSFQRIARDGEYIWIEKRPFGGSGTRSVLKMTLDRQYSETIAVPGLSDCIDVTTDGSLLYDAQQRAARDEQGGDHPHDLELPDRVRHGLPVLLEHDQLGPRQRHRADVVPG